MEVLANYTVIIILQCIMYQINTLYTFNLHNVIFQLYLNKTEGKNLVEYLKKMLYSAKLFSKTEGEIKNLRINKKWGVYLVTLLPSRNENKAFR